MVLRRFGPVVMVLALAAAPLAGCCPGGRAVLENLTLPPEEHGECALVRASEVSDGPVAPMPANPLSTSSGTEAGAIARRVTGSVTEGVRAAYAAVYECEPGGPRVRVYAVFLGEPADAEMRAALDAGPEGALYKGQLAAVVEADEDACGTCYDAVMARATEVFGK